MARDEGGLEETCTALVREMERLVGHQVLVERGAFEQFLVDQTVSACVRQLAGLAMRGFHLIHQGGTHDEKNAWCAEVQAVFGYVPVGQVA